MREACLNATYFDLKSHPVAVRLVAGVNPRVMNKSDVKIKKDFTPYRPAGRGRGRGGLPMSAERQAIANHNKREMDATQEAETREKYTQYGPHRKKFAAYQLTLSTTTPRRRSTCTSCPTSIPTPRSATVGQRV